MRPQGFGQGASGLEDLGWNDMGFEPPKPAEAPRDSTHDAFGEDVVEHPRAHPTGLTPIQSPVHHQQAEIADRFAAEEGDEEFDETAEVYDDEVEQAPAPTPAALVAAPAPTPAAPAAAEAPAPAQVSTPAPAPAARRAPRVRSAPRTKAKAAFTLRLDPERHLKLRLACAVDGRSAQHLVTDALDQLLDRMPELESMAAKAKRKG